MSKMKVWIFTGAFMALITALSVIILRMSLHGFRWIEAAFAIYGYVRFAMDLAKWLEQPIVYVHSGRLEARGERE